MFHKQNLVGCLQFLVHCQLLFEHFAVYYLCNGWEWERNAGHLLTYGRDTRRIRPIFALSVA